MFSANPHKSLLIFLSIITILISIPILSNIKQQQNSNAATPQVDRIFPTVGTPAGGDKVVIEGKNFILDSGVKQIGTGDYHNCILTYNNQVYCWELNNLGQLGNNSTTNSSTPVAVVQGAIPAGVTIKQISAGYYHNCILGSNDQVYCWGSNDSGQLGNGTNAGSFSPVVVAQGAIPAGVTITKISTRHRYTCAIASNDQTYCWGQNNYGQLGNNSTTNSYTPVAISQGSMSADTRSSMVATGAYHTCAVAFNNKIYCWGLNNYSQLGNGTTTDSSTPVLVSQGSMPPLYSGTKVSINNTELPSSSIKFINSNKLEITMPPHTEGKVNITLTNPDNTTTTITNAYEYYTAKAPTITSITPDSSNLTGGTTATLTGTNFNNIKWKQVSAGEAHTCAISCDNKVYCWGSNGYGQLGNGTRVDSSTPVQVSQGAIPEGVTINQISVGYDHVCAISYDNKAYCWGNNFGCQLGNNTYNSSSIPDVVSYSNIPIGVRLIQVSSGASFSCAIGSDGNAYCWGTTLYTITGNMHYGCVPTVVPRGEIPAGVSLTQISSGYDYACALASNNGIYCWGRKISNGSDIDSNSPVTVARGEIPADAHIVQISAGDSHVCVLDSDGRAYCWGYGSEGQLGNSVAVNSSKSPVAVSQALGALPGVYFVQLSSGGSHTCAIASDNKTYCWGRGQEGQLGQNYGSAGNAYRPVQVNQHNMLLGDYLIFVSLGTRYSCSISSLGLLYCWGKNNFNQLGNGLPDNGIASYIPTATIPSLTLKLGTDLTIPITGSNFTDTSLSFTIPAYTTPSLKDISLTNNTTTQNSNTLTSGFRYYSKPNPPTNLTISNSQPTNSLTLTWTSPSTGGIDSAPNQGNNFSPITDYQIDYCIADPNNRGRNAHVVFNYQIDYCIADPNNLNQCQDPTNSTPTTTNPTNWLSYPHTPIQSTVLTNLSTKITNLNPDQHYLIRIAAINQAGLSTYLTSQAKVPSYVTLSATPATTINLTPIYPNTVSTGAVDINFATNMNNGYHLNIEKSGNNTDGFGYSSLDVDGVNQEFPSAGRLGRAEWGFSMPNIPINTTRNQINLSQFTTTQDPVTNQDADLHMDKYSLLWPVTAVNATEIARYNAPDTGRRRIMIGINVPNTQASGTYQVILLFTMIGS